VSQLKSPTEPALAFLSKGKLHVRREGATQTIQSEYARTVRERAISIERRHAWKTQGRGARFLGGAWGTPQGDPSEFPVRITGVAPKASTSELVYSLETDAVSGIFALNPEGQERRLFHTADFRLRQIALHPDGHTLTASIFHNDFRSNIAVLQLEGSDFSEVTEGDSFDQAPTWVQGEGRRIVFQSAGIGRDAAGRFGEIGAFAIQELDLDSGNLESIAEQDKFNLFAPRKTADGTLYYIRNPHDTGKPKTGPLPLLLDTLLFPFRMGNAIFQYFNLFSMMYTGKPLTNAKGGLQKMMDQRRMMIEGNLAAAMGTLRNNAGDDERNWSVPSSWELVRMKPNSAPEVVASGVLSYDFASDGSIVYSSGGSLYQAIEGASPKKISGKDWMEQVVCI
jgi:hypothetical protein